MFHRSLIKNQKGATAIEFAFVALPFFMLMIGILELGMYYASATVMEGATVQAARIIRTGQAQESGDPLASGCRSLVRRERLRHPRRP